MAVLAAFAVLRLVAPAAVPRLIKEDGVLEYLQLLLYAAAGGLALLASRRLVPRTTQWTFVTFALACALVAAEEVSWGERLVGYDAPNALRALNTQNETNLHNSAPVQRVLHPAYILVGLAGGLGWRGRRLLPDGRTRRWLEVVLPDGNTALFFLPVALFYIWMEMTGLPTEGWLRSQDQEVFETLLAAGFALFAWTRAHRLSHAGSGDYLA